MEKRDLPFENYDSSVQTPSFMASQAEVGTAELGN